MGVSIQMREGVHACSHTQAQAHMCVSLMGRAYKYLHVQMCSCMIECKYEPCAYACDIWFMTMCMKITRGLGENKYQLDVIYENAHGIYKHMHA